LVYIFFEGSLRPIADEGRTKSDEEQAVRLRFLPPVLMSTPRPAAPWHSDNFFPKAPGKNSWGYRRGKNTDTNCDLASLRAALRFQRWRSIGWVWTPKGDRMFPPMVVPELRGVCRELRLKGIARTVVALTTLGATGFAFVVGLILKYPLPQTLGSKTFDLTVAAVVAGLLAAIAALTWQYSRFKAFTPEFEAQLAESCRYGAWLRSRRAGEGFTLMLIALFAGVYLLQTYLPAHSPEWTDASQSLLRSIKLAGLDQQMVHGDEWWRLLTAAFLHGSAAHLYADSLLLLAVGLQLERLGSSGVVALVFLTATLAGRLFVELLNPAPAIGASGGIGGLLAFLVVFGWHHRKELPVRFFYPLIPVAAVSALLYLGQSEIVDEFGFLGGFLAGLTLGFLLVGVAETAIPLELPYGFAIAGRVCRSIAFAVPAFIAGALLAGQAHPAADKPAASPELTRPRTPGH
jgi:membrane associated rhomboid family serine protease